MDPANRMKVLLNSLDFSDNSLSINVPLVVENKVKLGGNAIALKPRDSNAECRIIFDNIGELGQLRHKYIKTGSSTIMPNFGIDDYTGKAVPRKNNVLTMDTLRPTDILLYGSWISHGNKNKHVDEIRKEGNGYSFISQRGRYVKIVKTDQYFDNQQGYYYDGKISEYGRKGLRKAANGAYILKLAPNRILYKGCFGDNRKRAMATRLAWGVSFEDAIKTARTKGYKYVGLQYTNGFKYNSAEVWGDNNANYKRYGTRNCLKMKSGHIAGGSWTNAVYQVS